MGSLQTETWKSSDTFPGYAISTLGRVKSLKRRVAASVPGFAEHRMRSVAEKVLAQRITRNYMYVDLNIRPRKTIAVHVLVAHVYHGPRPEGMQVNHKDGDRLNNRPDNLEYVTPKANMQHALSLGLLKSHIGEASSQAKLTNQQALEIFRTTGVSQRKLAIRYGVSAGLVQQIKEKRAWKHMHEFTQ